MSLTISDSSINKLTHKIHEIRLRALQEIEEKLRMSLQLHEDISFNSLTLYKTLVECSKRKILPPNDLSSAVFFLLKSKYGRDLCDTLSVKRIRKDVLGFAKDASKTHETLALLQRYETDDVVESFQGLHIEIQDPLDLLEPSLPNLANVDYVRSWSQPHPVDLVEMKRIREALVHLEDLPNVENALKYAKSAIKNLPAEQFLQPPYLYKPLLDCLGQHVAEKEAIRALSLLTRKLQSRIKERSRTPAPEEASHSQVAVHSFGYSLFMALLTSLKDVSDHSCQEKLNQNFSLMIDVIGLIMLCSVPDENRALLRELTFFAKFYRESYERDVRNSQIRTNYLIVLCMICEIAAFTPPEGANPEVVCYSEPQKPIWMTELELNLMDFTLKEAYPRLFEQILQVCQATENSTLATVICSGDVLRPAIEVLRDPVRFSEQDLVLRGSEVLQTIRITRSSKLVSLLLDSVVACGPLLGGNTTLRKASEDLVVQLLANSDPEIQKLAYEASRTHVKNYFTGVLEPVRACEDDGFYFAGIPLTSDILLEIVCFGMRGQSSEIASAILTFLVKGATMGKKWKKLLEVLLLVMPLLQSVVDMSSKLGYAVFELFNPDFGLSELECLHGNLRFLFNQDPRVRDEALLRLIFLSSSSSMNDFYLPNLEHIKDTILNNVCVLTTPLPLRSGFQRGLYSSQTLSDLVKILKNEDSSPSVRHSALVQISALMEDPDLCELLYQQNDWPLILLAFDHSMRASYNQCYPDAAIPALQIITKLCTRVSFLRRNIAQDSNFMFLLVRALFLHHHDHDFKRDCSTLIFLLVFSDFVVGIDDLSFPHVLKDLHVPFVSDFHCQVSPFEKTSLLEGVFRAEEEDVQYIGTYPHVLQKECGTLNYRENKRTSFIHTSKNHDNLKREQWRFLRMTFATLWFDGLDNVLENAKSGEKLSPIMNLNYARSPKSAELLIDEKNLLDFDPALKLTEADLNVMQITSPANSIRFHVEKIEGASSHFASTEGICGLHSVLLLPHSFESEPERITKSIRRFVMAEPKTEADERVFLHVLGLLQKLVEVCYEGVLVWMLTQLSSSESVFLKLLKDYSRSLEIYQENAKLLRLVVRGCAKADSPDVQRALVSENIPVRLFEVIAEELKECDKECVASLVALLQTLVSVLDVSSDDGLTMKVIKNLFLYIQVIKPIAQTGSHIVKNCLLAINNLIPTLKQPNLDKYLRQLSGLCSHGDEMVRASAWNVLASYSADVKGAEAVVKELAFLPGGLHASILATICDETEASVVKGAASKLFVVLLSHKNSCGKLRKEVMPVSGAHDAHEIVVKILRKQRFWEHVIDQLERFSPSNNPEDCLEGESVTTPSDVTYFCSVLIAVFDLRTNFNTDPNELHALDGFIKTVTKIPACVWKATISMTAEVCKLVARYLDPKPLIFDLILHNPTFLSTLMLILDIRIYHLQDFCEENCKHFLQVLKICARTDLGYEIICDSLDEIEFYRMVEFFNVILALPDQDVFTQEALDCLAVLLMKESKTRGAVKFYEKLDSVKIHMSEGDFEMWTGSEALMKRLMQLFEALCAKDKPKNGVVLVSKQKNALFNAMHGLLRNTSKAREYAEAQNFFTSILDRLETVHSSIGMTCSDFIRKFGDRKKETVIDEMGNLLGLIGAWFRNSTLVNSDVITRVSRVFLLVWPWVKMTVKSEVQFLYALTSLSEDSLPTCQAIATTPYGQQASILKCVANVAVNETSKNKPNSVNMKLLHMALRVMTNACSCVEGRLALVKANVLDVVSKFHPEVTKNQGAWMRLTEAWLTFWEVLSRYPDGNSVRHLSVLCALIRKSSESLRVLALQIIRNFAFNQSNRSALLTSQDFIYVANTVLESGNHSEKLCIAVAIWRIIANSYKAKTEIKASSIVKRLNACSRQMVVSSKTDDELFNILTTIISILNK